LPRGEIFSARKNGEPGPKKGRGSHEALHVKKRGKGKRLAFFLRAGKKRGREKKKAPPRKKKRGEAPPPPFPEGGGRKKRKLMPCARKKSKKKRRRGGIGPPSLGVGGEKRGPRPPRFRPLRG